MKLRLHVLEEIVHMDINSCVLMDYSKMTWGLEGAA
jgi:hypothetical protein